MSNVLNEEKKQQAIALGRLGWSLRQIQKAIGVRRETISVYLRAAGIAMRAPRGQYIPAKPARREEGVITDPAESKPASLGEVITDSGGDSATQPEAKQESQPSRSPSSSACIPYQDVIELGLSRGRNAMAIWQELVDTCGFASGYQSVRRFVSRLEGGQSTEPCAVIETAPGEEAQVDYGDGPMVRDPQSGKYRRARLFVLTLGYSRKSVRLLVFRSSSQTWAELHEKAFRRLGGVTRVELSSIICAKAFSPRTYIRPHTPIPFTATCSEHYGGRYLPQPIRQRSGIRNRKGKVTRALSGTAKRTPLKGLRFENLQEAQDYLDQWEARWADTRIHGTTKRQVAVMFAEERPFLLPLPVEPFRHYQYGERTVHLDGCVEVEAAYYSAPHGWIGRRRCRCRWDSRQVRLLDPQTGQLLRGASASGARRASHRRRRPKSRKTPSRKHSNCCTAPIEPERRSAPSAAACTRLWARLRCDASWASCRWAKSTVWHDAWTTPAPPRSKLGPAKYHFVRRYLERNPQPPLSLRQIDPLIRQLTLYRDFIDNKTNQENKE